MADPRAITSRIGIDPVVKTYAFDASIVYSDQQSGGSVSAGLAVKLVSNGTVALATDGSGIEGKLLSVEPDFCSVQTEGNVELAGGTAAALTVGEKIVGALLAAAAGYIRAVATGTAAELGHAKHTIVDSSVTTAVEVNLGA